jgi:hypothetical protein
MVIDLDDEVVSLKFKGKEHLITKPTNGQVKEYTKALKLCEDDESKEKALELFLDQLGIGSELYNSMTPGQLKKLLEVLYSAEKN